MTNNPSRQEHYDTLSQSLDFFYAKATELEVPFDQFRAKCELFDHQHLALRLKKFNYKEELTPQEILVAEELIKKAESAPLIDKDDLTKEIRDSYNQLKAIYLKEIGIIEELEKFSEKEKFNNEVNIDMNIEILTDLKEVTLELLEKRGQLKDNLLSNLTDEKYDK